MYWGKTYMKRFFQITSHYPSLVVRLLSSRPLALIAKHFRATFAVALEYPLNMHKEQTLRGQQDLILGP